MDIPALAADFPPSEDAAWRALVEKTLKGGGPEDLVRTGPDGVTTRPLYLAAEALAPQPEAVRFGVERPLGAGRWDVRTVVAHPDPATAHAQAMQDLESGANSLLLRIDPTGEDGVALDSAEALAAVLAGVELELAPVALDAGFLGREAGGWLQRAGRASPRAKLRLHLDPLGAWMRAGESPGPITAHLAAGAAQGRALRDTYPEATLFLASGQAAHEAGAGPAEELAVMLASALAYLRALDEADVAPGEGMALLTLGLAADGEYFTTLAKVRAARALWARLATGFGEAAPARIEARSSRRMLSRLDPWVNLLRLTAAGFGAAVGGADALVLEPFTQPLGRPSDFARRQARNAQLVLMEESGLVRVEDAAGGCWFLEEQTDQLARAAWTLFQQIEAAGGIVTALEAGLIAGWVRRGRDALAQAVASGEAKRIGASVFRNPDEAPVALDPVDPGAFARRPLSAALPGEDGHCPPLTPWRMTEAVEEEEAGR